MVGKYIDPKKIYRFDPRYNAYNIDISIDYYREIYNEWDYSPIHNRELDQDLFDYLVDSSKEIPKKSKLIINFFLPKEIKNKERENKSIIGLKNNFSYALRKQYSVRRNMIGSTIIYSLSGFMLLIGAFLLKLLFIEDSFLQTILPEGLSIGGWVLIWEIFSIIFFKIREINTEIKVYIRLIESDIVYHYI